MRKIKNIYPASYSPIADLITYSPLPNRKISQVDPFLFLNHHGPQVYSSNNNGLPFGPHPHRGMETVTFIIDGDIMHKDSSGHESVITAGGVQWMTAGWGLIHAEVSSDQFKRNGGKLEIMQLWINLPSSLKMTDPFYMGLQKEDIPHLSLDNGKVTIKAVAGNWEGVQGAFKPKTDIQLSLISFEAAGELTNSIPENHNIFFYVISGSLRVNGTEVKQLHLVEFETGETGLTIEAVEESMLLFGHAAPFNEPLVAQGPFVMNTQEEIMQAYDDYRQGKFGHWQF
ncbi:pirin family protein [Desertivirga brevis]|uniref:pirin family protein n=1 Tax=Desertivirga brevis TaxID=2810310 RepID=UPI001A96D80C|nr:pirin family protein [Pedobacter sp. SYSU D00873]